MQCTHVQQECSQNEQVSSIKIKDLGSSCNRRHVRHSLPRVGRLGGTQYFFFLVHKTELWKSLSGWQSYCRDHPLYVSAEGSVHLHLSLSLLIFMVWLEGFLPLQIVMKIYIVWIYIQVVTFPMITRSSIVMVVKLQKISGFCTFTSFICVALLQKCQR